jgi:hypothetical protein
MKSASSLGMIILTRNEIMALQMEKGITKEKPVDIKAANVMKYT